MRVIYFIIQFMKIIAHILFFISNTTAMILASILGFDKIQLEEDKNPEINPIERNSLEFDDDMEEVLDHYYSMGIQLPYDILEELHFKRGKSKKELFEIIEVYRNHWKVECTKKMIKNPYK